MRLGSVSPYADREGSTGSTTFKASAEEVRWTRGKVESRKSARHTRYHMHAHNHATLVHAHEGHSKEDERSDHESAADTHDYDSPTGGIQNV